MTSPARKWSSACRRRSVRCRRTRRRTGLVSHSWLVAPENPLTARVAVNRLWSLCFGEGLVRTPNDFGLQGEAPSHPELLDWLAVRFRDGDADNKPWDIKGLLKLIVMSATFRQSSHFTPDLLARDPENRLLARGPRYRLPAEILRDQALAVGGLLVQRIGGPSVKPYQPPGLWEAVSYNGETVYEADKGESLYRRGLYTFWKRQSPPPDILTFDGPTREVCTVRAPAHGHPVAGAASLERHQLRRSLARLGGADDARENGSHRARLPAGDRTSAHGRGSRRLATVFRTTARCVPDQT